MCSAGTEALFSKAKKGKKGKKAGAASAKEKVRYGAANSGDIVVPASINMWFMWSLKRLSVCCNVVQARKKLKDGLSMSAKGYGDDMDLLESATVGAGDHGDGLDDRSGKFTVAYLTSSTAAAGATRGSSGTGGGGGTGGLLPSTKSAYEMSRKGSTSTSSGGGTGTGSGTGATIVKAEFSDMFFRQETPDGDANNLNLSKVCLACAPLCIDDDGCIF